MELYDCMVNDDKSPQNSTEKGQEQKKNIINSRIDNIVETLENLLLLLGGAGVFAYFRRTLRLIREIHRAFSSFRPYLAAKKEKMMRRFK